MAIPATPRPANAAGGAGMRAPDAPADVAALVNDMLALLPDPAAVEDQLLRGGEEGLTYRQLRRCGARMGC